MNAIDRDISRGMAAATKKCKETPPSMIPDTPKATANGELLEVVVNGNTYQQVAQLNGWNT
jgi:hypothetical protein